MSAARPDSARDLLFGLLALQNGLIDQIQLVAAFQAWTRDKSKPLADQLVNRGDLDAEQRGAIDAMVALHLRKHGSIDKSLAAVGVGASTRERLASLADPDIDASLPPPTRNVGADHTLTLDVGTATSEGQRFRVLRPHARGGLGAVFVALDDELHREVALKQILDDRADDPASRQRFVLEAEITGGLEHPGIVPVYGLGTHANGRPYYAMRFIKGDSLKDAITQFHNHVGNSRRVGTAHHDPVAHQDGNADNAVGGAHPTIRHAGNPTTTMTRELELRRLLRRFLDVCNAIHYAHARGVLHRDIKPGNIIVGKYGETLVVDWGLAKSRGMAEPTADERPLITSSSGGAPTRDGSAIGTPQYMSPEQARGELDRLDARSDVYSLGATLYHLLTGRPPFSGTIEEVLRGVERGEFTRPRQLDPTIDPALEAICLKAMALRQDDRYASAKALADDIERWTADEPVTAYPEPFSRRARRWMRRHRTLVTTTAATVLVGLAGLGAVAAVLATKNVQLDIQRQRAEDREQQAIAAVKRFRDAVADDPVLKNNEGLKDLRNRLLKEPLAFFRSLRERLLADRDTRPEAKVELARAVHDYAHLTDEIGDKRDGLKAHEDSLAIWQELTRLDPTKAEYQAGLAGIQDCRGNLLRETGQSKAALQSHEQARAIRDRLARENPAVTQFQNDLASSHNNIGILQGATGQTDAALRSHEQARAIRDRLARENPAVTQFQKDLASSHNNIGAVQGATGQTDAELRSHEQARSIRERLARENPAVIEFQSNLASSHYNIGTLQSDAGQTEAALRSYEQARAIRERLARENPAVIEFQSDLAASHNNLGILRRATSQTEAALRSYEQARAVFERLARENPAVTRFQNDLARTHNNIGNLHRVTGQDEAARKSYEQALVIRERLAREHPEVPDYASGLGNTLNNLARIDIRARRFQDALEQLAQANAWQKKALATNFKHPQYREFLADNLSHAIQAARGLGRDEEIARAQRELDELIATDPRYAALDARLAAVAKGEAPKDNPERLALARRAHDLGRHILAARLWSDALEADPKLADDRQAKHGYNAACAAVLTASGKSRGKDDPPMDDAANAKLRGQALGWLRTELTVWAKLAESGAPRTRAFVAQTLKDWREDTNLATIRDPGALATLPDAERQAWRSFWSDVDALLNRAAGAAQPSGELPENPFAP